MLLAAAGIKMTHVPYTGAGPAIIGLLGGSIDAVATGPATIVQQVNAGKLRALAQWGNVRLAALPDVPTFHELGTNVDYAQWSGLFVPAGTLEPIVKRLRDAARAAANDERVKQVGVPALCRCRCEQDGRRRQAHRQSRVTARFVGGFGCYGDSCRSNAPAALCTLRDAAQASTGGAPTLPVVMRPIRLAVYSANQRLLSGSRVVYSRPALPLMQPLNSATTTLVEIRPIRLPTYSVNHRLPSGPATM
jgi:hypothetical protein